jgi:hypothetical protein
MTIRAPWRNEVEGLRGVPLHFCKSDREKTSRRVFLKSGVHGGASSGLEGCHPGVLQKSAEVLDKTADSGPAFCQVFHFLSCSMLSRTRNAVILRIRGRGSDSSSGSWIDPFAVVNFESSFVKALTADGVG